MGLRPATGVRLVSTLALLRSRHLFLETLRRHEPAFGPGRNPNLTEQMPKPKSQNQKRRSRTPESHTDTRPSRPPSLRIVEVFGGGDLGFGAWDLPVLHSPVLFEPLTGGHWPRNLRFLPQDFHNCGKRCGKAGGGLSWAGKHAILLVFWRGETGPRAADWASARIPKL
jgi:hypothetical protein